MMHQFVDVANKTLCRRCGKEIFRVDEECPGKPSEAEVREEQQAADEWERGAVERMNADRRRS